LRACAATRDSDLCTDRAESRVQSVSLDAVSAIVTRVPQVGQSGNPARKLRPDGVALSPLASPSVHRSSAPSRGAAQRVSLDVFVERADAVYLTGKWSSAERSLAGLSDIFPAS
jgi:hypothetical protein